MDKKDDKKGDKDKKDDKKKSGKDEKNSKDEKELPKNKNTFEQEVTLRPDTTLTVSHGKKSKRLIVSAKTKDGKRYNLKYKVVDDNKILIKNKDSVQLKISVRAKEPLENQKWYRASLDVARVLMMVRNVSFSFRDQFSTTLPGFMPNIGDMFGQRTGGLMAPGLGFAFGLTGDNFINKAAENKWLLNNDSVSTPATTNHTQDLQLKVTLEPFTDFKIDLNASRTDTRAKQVQYMYSGMPTTQSGTFTMTTLSLKSAFEGIGDANNGYHSASFENFCNSLDGYRDRVEAQYAGAVYPSGTGEYEGHTFDPTKGTVDKYSADVMIPAFLSTYTGSGHGRLAIFPALTRLLPNWSVRYSGLGKLPLFSSIFKSVNINHSYKSVYAVGTYSSYSTYMEYMNGLGFISSTTSAAPIPSSMYNVSTVSVNEAFSPLLGFDVTLQNNLTAKLEYRTTRVLSLSMTSVQINEALSKDWVIGMGYKINDFNLFGSGTKHRKVKKAKGKANDDKNKKQNTQNNNQRSNNRALNLRLDFSFRKQAAITRDIATMTSSASSGNSALKISFMADYSLSKLLTLSAYYDRQTNTPLLSSSSYPTTTQDFGVAMKFSLTR